MGEEGRRIELCQVGTLMAFNFFCSVALFALDFLKKKKKLQTVGSWILSSRQISIVKCDLV